MDTQKKIVFFLGSMNRGGAERVISILSKEYAKRGWKTDICALLFNSVEYELHPDTVFHDLTGGNASRIRRFPYWLKNIRKFVKEENPDVIVSFAARINVLVLLACMGSHKKIVVSERNDPTHDGRGFFTKVLTKALYPRADYIVFQTKRVCNLFGKRIQRKGIIIPNPIEVPVESNNVDINKIVTVGRLTRQKNHKLLIQVFSEVHKKYPQKELYIYGDGELKDEINCLVSSFGLNNNVHLMGKVSDVHNQIQNAAMFVLPSDYEGLSNALLEAMMMGIPCVSTDCAGSDEYIKNGENGLLTPVGDQDKLADAMLSFIENDELRMSCGLKAKAVKDKVGLNSTMQQWFSILG